MGPFGAGLEVCLIFYLGATSVVGFYTMPFMRNVCPQKRKTSLAQLILNCALVLILSSALPLLSRIIGELQTSSYMKVYSLYIFYFRHYKFRSIR